MRKQVKIGLLGCLILALTAVGCSSEQRLEHDLYVSSEVIETDTIRLKSLSPPQGSWVLIDLDFTLFEAADTSCHASWFYETLEKLKKQGKSKNEAIREFYPEWVEKQKNCPVKPIEKDMISWIHNLQKNRVTVFGFTSRQKAIAKSTIDQVHSLGVYFEETAPIRSDWEKETPECPVLFDGGILFACDYNEKGDVFGTFLNDYSGNKPTQIIFVDDGKDNIVSMKKTTALLRIPFLGIHYTGYKKVK